MSCDEYFNWVNPLKLIRANPHQHKWNQHIKIQSQLIKNEPGHTFLVQWQF